MPIPDLFFRAPDFFQCPWCLKDYQDTELKHGFFRVNDDDQIGRVYYICKNCLDKAEKNKQFEKRITNKVFKNKLGRVVKIVHKETK